MIQGITRLLMGTPGRRLQGQKSPLASSLGIMPRHIVQISKFVGVEAEAAPEQSDARVPAGEF